MCPRYDFGSRGDSEDSDGYSDDSDMGRAWGEYMQRTKWRFKTKSKLYADRDRKYHVFNLTTKAKGKSRSVTTAAPCCCRSAAS